MSGYVTISPPSFYYMVNETVKTFAWKANGQQRWENGFSDGTQFLFGRVGHWVIICLSGINILKEVRAAAAWGRILFDWGWPTRCGV